MQCHVILGCKLRLLSLFVAWRMQNEMNVSHDKLDKFGLQFVFQGLCHQHDSFLLSIFLSCIFVLFMYRHLITHKLQRLYEDFHKEAPADLLAHLGSLDAYSNQFRTYMLKPVFTCIVHASKVATIMMLDWNSVMSLEEITTSQSVKLVHQIIVYICANQKIGNCMTLLYCFFPSPIKRAINFLYSFQAVSGNMDIAPFKLDMLFAQFWTC